MPQPASRATLPTRQTPECLGYPDSQRIRPHGGLDRRVLAVLLHEQVGGAVDVEVGDYRLGLTEIVAASSSLSLDTLVCPRHGRPRLGPIDLGGHSAMMGTGSPLGEQTSGHDVRGLARDSAYWGKAVVIGCVAEPPLVAISRPKRVRQGLRLRHILGRDTDPCDLRSLGLPQCQPEPPWQLP